MILIRCCFIFTLFVMGLSSAQAAHCLNVFPEAFFKKNTPKLNVPSFKRTSSSKKIKIGQKKSRSIKAGSFEEIELEKRATANFVTSNKVYKIKKLVVKENSVVNFSAGDYWIEEADIEKRVRFNVRGLGTVRIYVKKEFKAKEYFKLNDGGVAKVIFVVQGLMKLSDGSRIYAAVHANEFINDGSARKTISAGYGAFSTKRGDKLSTKNFSYNAAYISSLDFNGMCQQSSIIDHYRFIIASTGLTCLASDIAIKACTNAACTTVSSKPTTITLSPTRLWSGRDVSGDKVTFTGSSALKLSQPDAGLLSISATSLSPQGASAVKCTDNVSGSKAACSIMFKKSGFIFSHIPTQISNKASAAVNSGQELSIQAVEENTSTGSCAPILINNPRINLSLKGCTTGSDCGFVGVKSSNVGIEQLVSSESSSVLLIFDNEARAKFILHYPDAGKLTLTASKKVRLASGAIDTIVGDSNSFVVRPLGFRLEFPQSIDPISSAEPAKDFSIFTRAGDTFVVDVIPVGWKGSDIIDSSNPPVKYFTGNNAILVHSKQFPVDSLKRKTANGTLRFTSKPFMANPINKLSSARLNDVAWNEVGIIKLTAKLAAKIGEKHGNYLNTGDIIGSKHNIGRFIPADFLITPNHGSFIETQKYCGNFSYVGQKGSDGKGTFSYLGNPSILLTPRGINKKPLQNYQGDFSRLSTSSFVVTTPMTDAKTVGVDGKLLRLDGEIFSGDISAGGTTGIGTYHYSLSDDDHFMYVRNKNALVAPFVPNIQFAFTKIADADGVTVEGKLPVLSPKVADEHRVTYGRIRLTGAFGSDKSTLGMPISYQFFNGSAFTTHVENNCESYVLRTDIYLTPSSFNFLQQKMLPNDVVNVDKGFSVMLLPPAGIAGAVDVEFLAPSWLRFDWDNNAVTVDTNPVAQAMYGIYRGNDRVINKHERR